MMDAAVDAYIGRSKKWPAEMVELRSILADSELEESLKWGKPCYSFDNKNIVIMQEMKAFLALMFFQGALLDDPARLLHSQGPNSQSALRMEFHSVEEIAGNADRLQDYLQRAIAVAVSGQKVAPAARPEVSPELQAQFYADPTLQTAFEALTPGRQREYHLHFNSAKKSETRTARIEKCLPSIRAGKGFRD